MSQKDINFTSYSLIDLFGDDDHSISDEFFEYSKIDPQMGAELTFRVQRILSNPGLIGMMTTPGKNYSSCKKISLPDPDLKDISLRDALINRRSVSTIAKEFGGGPVTLEDLSSILLYSYGVTGFRGGGDKADFTQYARATVSAGGLYPLEIYPVVFNADGIDAGLYHFDPYKRELSLLRGGDLKEEFLDTSTYRELCDSCSVVLVISAVFERTLSKYLNRGLRFLLNDAGALIQSAYLTATARDISVCAIGGFYDRMLGDFTGLDNVNEAPIICIGLGEHPKETFTGFVES